MNLLFWSLSICLTFEGRHSCPTNNPRSQIPRPPHLIRSLPSHISDASNGAVWVSVALQQQRRSGWVLWVSLDCSSFGRHGVREGDGPGEFERECEEDGVRRARGALLARFGASERGQEGGFAQIWEPLKRVVQPKCRMVVWKFWGDGLVSDRFEYFICDHRIWLPL